MSAIRVVARLDVKNSTVVKGRCMEGLRVVGEPGAMAERYANDGADELLFVDVVATLYERCGLYDVIDRVSRSVFVPMTVCGGLRSLDDMRKALMSGADKLAVNTAALARPALITEAANALGSQAIVVSIEAKKRGDGYEAFTDSGREPSGRDAIAWAEEAASLGAGEILVTSVDRDGTMLGFDDRLLREIAARVLIPVVASGGCSSPEDATAAARQMDAVAIGAALHSGRTSIGEVKAAMMRAGVRVRPMERAA